MKKLMDSVFVSLPIIAVTVVILILSNQNLYETDWYITFIGYMCVIIGGLSIVFNKEVLNFSARWHSYFHKYLYRSTYAVQNPVPDEAEGGEPLFDISEKPKFKPTRLSYIIGWISSFTVYILGFVFLFIQISILRSML